MAHAKYKAKGGKLTVVDLDVVDGRISSASVTGDFFLEPDSVLDVINDALIGIPADSSAEHIAAQIRAALPKDAALVGTSPDAIAIAVRRALSGASHWNDYPWRLVRGPALDPYVQVALDQVLTERVAAGLRAPTLRFWEWDSSAIILGSFQSVRNEVDLEAAERYGIPIVRRISGGGAMFMEAGSVIVYSITAPVELVQGMSFPDSYAFLDDWAVEALQTLGIDATYQPLNDISSPIGKIGGAAQKRLAGGALLHHATLAYDMDGERMAEVLRIGRDKISDKGITSAAKRVDPLRAQTGLGRDDIIDRMIEVFRERHGLVDDELLPAEIIEAEALAESKFRTREWIERLP